MDQHTSILNKLLLCILLSIGFSFHALSQPQKTRILFVLDGSGSMASEWNHQKKFSLAKELLYKAIDSVQRENKNIEFALRVFGHQSPKQLNDCEDSELIVGFGNKNASRISSALDNIKNQGQTPIAYSLFQATQDFPQESNVRNIIVLITDGIETCEGDPCAVQGMLAKRNISLKPFIIGLGIGQKGNEYFDCVGTYYDAQNRSQFNTALNVVVSQAMNTTTAQINLLDTYGQPTETNIEVTLYDAFSGRVAYNFVHALDKHGLPDTLQLNATARYNLTVHTTPPIEKINIELNPGKHNVLAVDAPQGYLVLKISGSSGFSDIKAIIRKTDSREIIDVLNFNYKKKLITGNYDLEILSTPRKVIKNVKINQSKETIIEIDDTGFLKIRAVRPGLISIYQLENNRMQMVYEDLKFNNYSRIEIQPGTYQVVYRPNAFKSSRLTQTKSVTVKANQSLNIQF